MRYPKRQVVSQPFISQLDAIEKTLIEVQSRSVLVYGGQSVSLRKSVSGGGKYVEMESLRKSVSRADQYSEGKSNRKFTGGGIHSSKYGKNDISVNSGFRFEKGSSERSNIGGDFADMEYSNSSSPSPNIFGPPTSNIPLSLFDPFKPMEFPIDKSILNSPFEMEFGLEPQLSELLDSRRSNSSDRSFSKNIWNITPKKSPVWG